MSWLMFQMGGVGPIFGQLGHFRGAPENPYALQRFTDEVVRLYTVMDTRLGEVEYLAGDYSIADMATYPWTSRPGYFDLSLDSFPNVKRWAETIGQRPAIERALATNFE